MPNDGSDRDVKVTPAPEPVPNSEPGAGDRVQAYGNLVEGSTDADFLNSEDGDEVDTSYDDEDGEDDEEEGDITEE